MALTVVPVMLAAMLIAGVPRPELFVPAGLCAFGVLFAVNSSIHSYLVLAYAGSEQAAEDVGFHYAANAAGRFGGTYFQGSFTHRLAWSPA